MSGMNLRAMALSVLSKVWDEGAYLTPALGAVYDSHDELSGQERGFLTRLCYGTVEKLLFLDGVIAHYSSTPLGKLRPLILRVLRISVYQIYFMDGVPEHAICSEAVKLVKKRGLTRLSGFVNGLLRAVLRDGRDADGALVRIGGEENPELTYSIPGWIISLWQRDYGEVGCRQICEGFSKSSPTTVWMADGGGALSEDIFVPVVPCDGEVIIPRGVYRLNRPGSIEKLPAFLEGRMYVQDIASMQPVLMAGIAPGVRILDVCAAPGGKSLLACAMGAVVESRDISDEKTDKIRENISRMGMEGITVRTMDALTDDPDSHESYDVVIADLPCSGLGVLSKKPELRYRVAEADIEELAGLQRRILDVVSAYVRPGGRLIFSTCTIDRRENDDNTRAFLKGHPGFTLTKEKQIFPKAGQWDGFYVALMDRNG